MKKVAAMFRGFMKDEEGATLLEYGMLVLLIAVLCVAAIKAIGTKVSAGFTTINSNLP
ncbi:MAG TPA: Flp family type IVb pilin [Gemmatimonadaceae bacterium]|nr:Flp family type IVb pilin [Gemmatimonadaceae bacterium]